MTTEVFSDGIELLIGFSRLSSLKRVYTSQARIKEKHHHTHSPVLCDVRRLYATNHVANLKRRSAHGNNVFCDVIIICIRAKCIELRVNETERENI